MLRQINGIPVMENSRKEWEDESVEFENLSIDKFNNGLQLMLWKYIETQFVY